MQKKIEFCLTPYEIAMRQVAHTEARDAVLEAQLKARRPLSDKAKRSIYNTAYAKAERRRRKRERMPCNSAE